MANLIFSLNATIPVFLVMVLGFFLHQIGWIDDLFAQKMNQFVFRVPLPVMLFYQLAHTDFRDAWDTKFVLFCFFVTLASITIAVLISRFLKDPGERGEFIQASYRSSAAILGVAYISNIYGDAGMAPLMMIGSVPLYNVMAVVILTVTAPASNGKTLTGSGALTAGGTLPAAESGNADPKDAKDSSGPALSRLDPLLIRKTLRGIITNPIILGILAGLLWSLSGIHIPHIINKTLSEVGVLSTPLGLLAMGASVEPSKVSGELKPAIIASILKLVGFCALFLPLAVSLGFRNQKLVAILIMLGSASTVTCFVMAKNMGHEGTLSTNAVMITTILSAFTITMWLFILKSLGYL